MARVEANIESNMQTVLNDWGLYQAAKEKRCTLIEAWASMKSVKAEGRLG